VPNGAGKATAVQPRRLQGARAVVVESHAFSARHQRAPVEGSRAEPNLDFFQGNF